MKDLQKGFVMQIVVALIAIALVLGGVWYMTSRSENSQETEEEVSQSENFSEEKPSFSGSLFDLASSGKDYRCTLTSTVGGFTTDGVVYVSGENIKGEFNTDVPQFGRMTSYMIANKDSVYTWSSFGNQGFVFPKSETSQGNENASLSGGQSFDYNGRYDYRCESWSVDNSVFVPPANISFSSF